VPAGPLSAGVAHLTGHLISEFMASAAFQRVWADANRLAHSQLISVLNGDSTLVQATGGEVVLNLVPLVSDVLHAVPWRLPALTRRTSALARVQIPLFPAAALARARRAYRILTAVTWLVLVLTPLAFAGALAASPRRRRTLLQLTVSGTLTLVAAGAVLSWLRSGLVARAVPEYHALTSVIVHALTNGFVSLTTWCVAVSLATTAVVAQWGTRGDREIAGKPRSGGRRA
jgi:hypothetical protein